MFLQFVQGLLALLLFSGSLLAQETMPSADASLSDLGYALGAGDHIHISVHDQSDLSGDYVLNGDGRFSMPLIGTINAAGLTTIQLEELVVDALKPDYLVSPRVSIEVKNYRPFYIVGEVEKTGSFNYIQDITYLTAIAMAGGYTYRAKKDVVYVTRGNDPKQKELKLDVNEKVQPGDIIRVAERLF